jgi:hypothetical protein
MAYRNRTASRKKGMLIFLRLRGFACGYFLNRFDNSAAKLYEPRHDLCGINLKIMKI